MADDQNEIERLRARVDELLRANNEELERRRQAEHERDVVANGNAALLVEGLQLKHRVELAELSLRGIAGAACSANCNCCLADVNMAREALGLPKLDEAGLAMLIDARDEGEQVEAEEAANG